MSWFGDKMKRQALERENAELKTLINSIDATKYLKERDQLQARIKQDEAEIQYHLEQRRELMAERDALKSKLTVERGQASDGYWRGLADMLADNRDHALAKVKELQAKLDSLTREVVALRSVLSEYGSDHSGFSQWIIANEIRDEREKQKEKT